MPRLRDACIAVLIGAVVVLSVACAPRSARGSASSEAPARCNGVAVLDVQNDLSASIQIFEVPGSPSQRSVPVALLGPGWHTLDIDQAGNHRYRALTVGNSPFGSYPVMPNDPRLRIAVRCRATG
jgi:hypothetical protein